MTNCTENYIESTSPHEYSTYDALNGHQVRCRNFVESIETPYFRGMLNCPRMASLVNHSLDEESTCTSFCSSKSPNLRNWDYRADVGKLSYLKLTDHLLYDTGECLHGLFLTLHSSNSIFGKPYACKLIIA